MLLSCQEQLIPGDSLPEKWDRATAAGFDAIELRGKGDFAFEKRLPELLAAKAAGVLMPTVCVDMLHFIGDFDTARRSDAVAQLKSQLSVIAELGGRGAMTPASYGMFSRRLPPFEPPRDEAGDREVLLAALTELGEHAGKVGVSLFLEPLNRYEDHMVNRLDQAAELARATGLDTVSVVADSYHMNIEEDDVPAALVANAARLSHVQVSDSNRFQPGAGHLDWAGFLTTLDEIGYDGYLALECRLRGEPIDVLPEIPAFLRGVAA